MPDLIFVYNADSGLMSGMFDFFHKIMKPDTYSCSLCMITHHSVGKRSAWGDYLKSLPLQTEFYHRNDFIEKYPDLKTISFPSILLREKNTLSEIVDAEELSNSDLTQLMRKINNQIAYCRYIPPFKE